MNCPSCGGELAKAHYEGFPVHRCPGCYGLWVEGSVLLEIISNRKTAIPPEAIEAARQWRLRQIPKTELDDVLECPKCGMMLNRSVYAYNSGIIIDRCLRGCGVWLDSGELEQLTAFDRLWSARAKEVLAEKGLMSFLKESKGEDPKSLLIRRDFTGRSVIGWLADIFVDFLS